jgi:hypothetical protein
MSLIVIFSIIFIHWFADFVLQTHWQATNKSKNNKALTMHVLSYSTVWLLITNAYSITTGNYLVLAFFAPITFVCHWITDYFTSRLNSVLWAKGDVHNFFVSVGFDQVLHYLQLFLTFYLLTK